MAIKLEFRIQLEQAAQAGWALSSPGKRSQRCAALVGPCEGRRRPRTCVWLVLKMVDFHPSGALLLREDPNTGFGKSKGDVTVRCELPVSGYV